MNKEEIVTYLTSELSSVYCDTCNPNTIGYKWDDEKQCEVEYEIKNGACEECYRKKMNWALSKEVAEKFADKILEDL